MPRVNGQKMRLTIARSARFGAAADRETRNRPKASLGHPHETLRLKNQVGYPSPEGLDAAFFVHGAQ